MKKRFFKIISVTLMLTLLVGNINVFAAKIGSETEVSKLGQSFTKMNQIAMNSTEVIDSEKTGEMQAVLQLY